MQPYPQPGHPQLQNAPQQPLPQYSFSVTHNNPQNQLQQPHTQQTQEFAKSQQQFPQQGHQYVPPQSYHQSAPQYVQPQQPYAQPGQVNNLQNQHAMQIPSNPQGASAAQKNDKLLVQMEVNLIDQRLSTGCYACYNCWLYVILICSILGLYTNSACMISLPLYFFAFLESLAAFGYAFTMINVMRDKKMKKAELGVKFAFATAILLPGTIYAQYSFYADYTDHAKYIFYAILPYIIYDYFVMILPALKIRNHIQSRDTIMRKSTDPYYA